MEIKKTERGWAGHFICADKCKFRRNTLLEYNGINIVVSTVGLMSAINSKGYDQIGCDRYFETMAFRANDDKRYYDANVRKEIRFDSEWAINEIDADDKANIMHENVVTEITKKLLGGNKFD